METARVRGGGMERVRSDAVLGVSKGGPTAPFGVLSLRCYRVSFPRRERNGVTYLALRHGTHCEVNGGEVYIDRVLYGRRDYLRILFCDTQAEP